MLLLTFWFDSSLLDQEALKPVTFVGRRLDVTGTPTQADTFTQEEYVEGVIPAGGPASITARIRSINSGRWTVGATVSDGRHARDWSSPGPGYATTVFNESVATKTGAGRLTPSRLPGLIPSAWLSFVSLGVIAGSAIQALMLSHNHLNIVLALPISLCAAGVGSVGASLWFLMKHRLPWRNLMDAGMCVQGFLTATVIAAIIGAIVAHLPVGAFFDATAPSLFFGLAIGRIGCFFAGCCAGRPTKSRWGIWSSDGKLGTRRVPTQVLESVASFIIGLVALSLQPSLAAPGAIFVGSWLTYTMFREFVAFPLRAPYRASRARPGSRKAALGQNPTLSQSIAHPENCGFVAGSVDLTSPSDTRTRLMNR